MCKIVIYFIDWHDFDDKGIETAGTIGAPQMLADSQLIHIKVYINIL